MNRLALALLAVLAGCATPVAPTGGPADAVPPALVRSTPADGATNVADSTVVLTFSERLDPGSGAAVAVTPAGDVAPRVRVSAREVEVALPALRDSTTYVVTVGTELRDQRGVALRAPVTLAFATGDRIDRGTLGGTLRDPETGAGLGGRAVWAYALEGGTAPDPRAVAPAYRTETGADGAFELLYLRPGPYFVVAVGDRNRNGRADPGETFAAPPVAALGADTTGPPPVTLWETRLDSLPPVAQRVRAFSDRRFAVRFSESVRPAGGPLVLEDSASGRAVGGALRLYQPPDAPFELFVEAETALPPRPARVSSAAEPAVADSAGLAAGPFALVFTPPSRPDTARSRLVGFVPAGADSLTTLQRGQRPGARFSSPPDADRVALRADGLDGGGALELAGDGLTVVPDSAAALGGRFRLEVAVGDSVRAQAYAVPGPRDTGAIVGRVEGAAPVVEVRGEAGPPVAVAVLGDGTFSVDGLVPGPYAVRAWSDLDGDGAWSGGALAPYRPPEPLVLLAEPVVVRARWETEIDPVVL